MHVERLLGNGVRMWARILRGAAAGAAGTTALNMVTFLDMAARGRPASSTPQQTVERVAGRVGLSIPGDGATRSNRLDGLGALGGLLTGVAVGMVYGAVDDVVDGALARLPVIAGGLLVGTAALVGANGPMAALGISDPRQWTSVDWASDLVPHIAFGVVAAATYRVG